MSDTPVTPRLSPHLVCDGAAAAIDFYKKAFDAEEVMRLPGPNGTLMHGSVMINGAMVLLVDEMPEYNVLGPTKLGGSPVTIHLVVSDVDASVAKAVEAGAIVTMPVADQFWGDRYGVIKDPFGHNWSIATPKPNAPRTEAELQEAAKGVFG